MRISRPAAFAAVVVALACAVSTAAARPFRIALGHFPQPPSGAQCEAQYGVDCYGPQQIQRAYDMNPLYDAGLTGAGKTIVVVDSYGAPTIAKDLAGFDRAYGLPAPPSLTIAEPAGPVPRFNPNKYPDQPGWAGETDLDVEWSHAMAPGAAILVVQTPVDETEGVQGLPEMVQSENFVIDHHLGDVISQSFGATEQTFPSPQSIYRLRSANINAATHGVTMLGATGDAGATDYEADLTNFYTFPVVDFPEDDPLVTAVGGTDVHLDPFGNRTQPDSVWNDPPLPDFGVLPPAAGNGGLSTVFARPGYQDGVASVVGARRGLPDVSLSAACADSVNVYQAWSAPESPAGWYQVCGTSEASPLFAGVVAVADQAARHDLGLLNPALYALGNRPGSPLVDITRGNNTVTFVQPGTGQTITVQGWAATPGYDLASGLGTPDGARLVAALAGYRTRTRR